MFPLPHICVVAGIQSISLSIVTYGDLEGLWEGCITTAGFIKRLEAFLPYSWREIEGFQCLTSCCESQSIDHHGDEREENMPRPSHR